MTGVQNQHLVVKLVNAGESSFPVAWPGYRACASYDLKDWFRVNTTWDEKAGVIQMEHMSNHVSFAACCDGSNNKTKGVHNLLFGVFIWDKSFSSCMM